MKANTPQILDKFVEKNRDILEEYISIENVKSDYSYAHDAFVYRTLGYINIDGYREEIPLDLWRDIVDNDDSPRYSLSLDFGEKQITPDLLDKIKYMSVSFGKSWEKWSRENRLVYCADNKFYKKAVLEITQSDEIPTLLYLQDRVYEPSKEERIAITRKYNNKKSYKFISFYFKENEFERVCKMFFNKFLPTISKEMNVSKRQESLARIGQGKYRKGVANKWNGCSVTGCKNKALLTASHIKPWYKSNSREKLDKHNGLFLIATLDKAFDKFLISFDDNGKILISKSLSKNDRKIMGISAKTRIKDMEKFEPCRRYMEFHRNEFYERENNR